MFGMLRQEKNVFGLLLAADARVLLRVGADGQTLGDCGDLGLEASV